MGTTHELTRGVTTPEETFLPAGTGVRAWPDAWPQEPPVPSSGLVKVAFVHPTFNRLDRPTEFDWRSQPKEVVFRSMPIGGGYKEQLLVDASLLRKKKHRHASSQTANTRPGFGSFAPGHERF